MSDDENPSACDVLGRWLVIWLTGLGMVKTAEIVLSVAQMN